MHDYPLMNATERPDHDREAFRHHLRDALQTARPQHPRGPLHNKGLCGGPATTCDTCRRIDTWALKGAILSWPHPIPPRIDGEAMHNYARALGIPMADVWPTVARWTAHVARKDA